MPGLYPPHPAVQRFRVGQYGGHGLLNAAWLEHLQRDPDMHDAVLCMDLVFGSDVVVRIATRDCTTTSGRTGQIHSYRGSLQAAPELTTEMTPGDPSSAGRSLQVALPDELVGVAQLVAQGRLLAGVAEVSLQVDGGDHDDRLVLLRGDLTDVQYGAREQLVQLTVADPKDTSDLLLPPYTLTQGRHAQLLDGEVGKALAVVLPECQPIQGRFVGTSTSSPLVVLCHGTRTVGTVYVDGVPYSSGSALYPWNEVHALDDAGEPYTGIQFTGGFGTFTGTGGPPVYATLRDGPTNGHPVQVARLLVERFSTLGELGAIAYLYALAEARTGYLLAQVVANASGGSSARTLSFIEGELLASFPMLSMLWWGGGYGPVVADRRDERIVARLEADTWPLLDRASSVVETPKAECSNVFSVRYGYDPLTDTWAGYVERHPGNSALCDYSRSVVGARTQDPIESLWIQDSATANAVADWLVAHRTLPSYDVDYDCTPQLVLRLVPGDNVTITDPEFAWKAQVATVVRTVWRQARATVTLRVWAPALAQVGAAGGYLGAAAPSGGQVGGGQNPQPGQGD